jgi:hypothetical protein
MAIQQMGLLHYRAPETGGADSASLQAISEQSISTSCRVICNPTATGVGTIIASPSNTQWTWKTGPNPASDYEIKYIESVFVASGSIADGGDQEPETWYNLGTVDTPIFTSSLGNGNYSEGYLVIRNKNNTGVELANVTVALTADPNI